MAVTVKWNDKTKKLLKALPGKIVEEIARNTLDKTHPIIPMSSALIKNNNRGRLRRETMAKGVQKEENKYYLESSTPYALRVYNFNDNTTNWSTPNTHSQWFDRTWNKQGNSIANKVIERHKL